MSARSPYAGFATTRDAVGNQPAGAPARIQTGERFGSTIVVLGAGLLGLLTSAVLLVWLWPPDGTGMAFTLLRGLLLAALAIGLVLAYLVFRELLWPMRCLRTWAAGMCAGDLGTRIPATRAKEFSRLAFHVNRLSHALDRLANEMDAVVGGQTARLEEKNQSIAVLYEVAATLNAPGDLDTMLRRAARKLMEVAGASGAVLRTRAEPGLPALFELEGFEGAAAPLLKDAGDPATSVLTLESDAEIALCAPAELGYDYTEPGAPSVLRVPLRYRYRSVGVMDLFTPAAGAVRDAEVLLLFENVGKNLGMAIEKARLDAQAQSLVIGQERAALAHELHDSLAQTIAGLRFQVRMLEETLAGGGSPAARREVARIRGGVDEAHVELRELLANFRAPIDERGVHSAVRDLAERFGREAGPAVFVQLDGPTPALPAAHQLQVVRIVGEALANARQHSDAQTVRVLIENGARSGLRVLIEDDGDGIGEQVLDAHAGEHLGLSIMRERAQRIGGTLVIESEAGEGTRVELCLPARAEVPGAEVPGAAASCTGPPAGDAQVRR